MAHITKTFVERSALPRPDGKQAFYFDDSTKGFGIRVTTGSKTFILDRKLKGKTIRVSIGRFPDWSVQQARERARELIVDMDRGIDVRQAAKAKAAESITLDSVFQAFLAERPLKPRTQSDYQRYMAYYFQDWLSRPVRTIDQTMVMTRYKRICESSSGPSQASSAMRCLRSVLNYAIAHHGGEIAGGENPVLSLTAKRVWLRDRVRSDHLANRQVGPFVRAIRNWPNGTMAAYIEFILLTGARRGEAATLTWGDVDLRNKTLVFRDTKNHTDRTIPMTGRVEAILRQLNLSAQGTYVFSSTTKDGKLGHIKEPRKAVRHANAAAQSAVTTHGLRRTFCTLLESLDCPNYPLKALMGHSVRGDVTATHYNQMSVDRLRPWMERYEALLLYLVAAPHGDQRKVN